MAGHAASPGAATIALCSLQHARALWAASRAASDVLHLKGATPHAKGRHADAPAESMSHWSAPSMHPLLSAPLSTAAVYSCQYKAVADALRQPARRSCTTSSWALQVRCISHTSAHKTAVIAFPLAQTGEGISECELIQWFVKEGDAVKEFDKLCEVQSDKASVEISSRFDGVVRKLLHGKGDVVKVGATLVELEVPAGTPIPADLQAHVMAGSPEVTTTAQPVLSPEFTAASAGPGPNNSGGAMSAAAADQSAQVVLQQVSQQQDAAAQAAAAAARGDGSARGAEASSAMSAGQEGEAQLRHLLASPSVRRMARDMGVSLHLIKGTGPQGRITKDDLHRYADSVAPSSAHTAAHPAAGHPAPSSAAGHPHQPQQGHAPSIPRPPPLGTSVLPLRGYRKAMARSMAAVVNVPHFHLHDEAQVDVVTAVRKAMAHDLALHGAKLTLLPFIIKAVSLMLQEQPLLNASLAPDGASITLHGSHNIGVAMATSHGLVVPNIKQVESLSVVQVAREVARLQAAALSNKLTTEDVTGGTITISNIGSIGGMFANPLVHPPEVAILAVGRTRPVAATSERRHSGLGHATANHPHHELGSAAGTANLPGVQHVVGLSWGADHRVVDGAALAAASNAVKAYLEAPERMLIRLS